MISIKKTIVIFFLVISGKVHSQPFVDLLSTKYQYFQKHPYSDNNSSSLRVNLFDVTFLLPFERKNKSVVLIGGNFKNLMFESSGADNRNDNLYSAALQVGYDHQWKNEKWKTLFMFIPKINSDEINSFSDSHQFGGAVLFNYKKSKTVRLKFGLYYNREFFGNNFIPLAGIDWKINEKTHLFGNLPATINLEYKINKSFYAGISYTSVVSTYRIHDTMEKLYVREGKKSVGDDQLRLFLHTYVTKRIVVYAEFGATYRRIFEVYNQENEKLDDQKYIYRKTGDGLFVTAGIAYRIRLDSEN